jgi:hypothetical protein
MDVDARRIPVPRIDPYRVVAGGVAVAAAILLLAFVSMPEARREDLTFEIAKAAIQVVPLAFFGVVVGELVRRRDADRARKQQRVDFLRSFLSDVVLSYNRTKAIRRTLRGAGVGPTGHGKISDDDLHQLDAQLLALSDTQLDLERLKRSAEANGVVFGSSRTVPDALRGLEKYVNDVVKEWESRRPGLRRGVDNDTFRSWTSFWAFLSDKETGGSFGVPADCIQKIEQWVWDALIDRETSVPSEDQARS